MMLEACADRVLDWDLAQLDELAASEPLPSPSVLLVLFAPYCRRLIRRYGSTPEQRQDLLGEIYCILHELREAYDTTRGVPPSAYLFTQLRSSIFTRARREWRVQQREVSTSPLEEEWWEAQAIAQDRAPDRIALREILLQAIKELPERQRTVVYLRFFQEQEFEAIASAMGVKQATVRSLLRNGLDGLRKMVRADRRLHGAFGQCPIATIPRARQSGGKHGAGAPI